MDNERFAVLLPYISADLISMIVKKQGITEAEAVKKLYLSKLYALLEDEDTKVWQYSTLMLYSLFEQEEKNDHIEFPDV